VLERARRHGRAALKANPRHPFYRQIFRNITVQLTIIWWALGEHAEAAATAGELSRLGWSPADNACAAACMLSLCVPVAKKDARLPEARRQELARSYGDRAVEMLRQAVAKGYKDAARLGKDPALEPLRSRPDFQKLLKDLEGRAAAGAK
jgi:hypothetical protein